MLNEKYNYYFWFYVIELLNTQTIYSHKINDHNMYTRLCPFGVLVKEVQLCTS